MSTSYITPDSETGGQTISINLGKNQTRALIPKTFVLRGSGNRAGSNKLIVTQEYAQLKNEYDISIGNTVTVSDDVSTPVSFEGHANGKKMKYMAPSETNVSSLISFTGFSCKETSGSVGGQAITASFGDVENFEGGLSEYDYFINVTIPSGTTPGRYGVVLVTADSTSGPTESVTYYVDVAEHQTVPIEIHGVYKSYDQIVETLNTDLTWQQGTTGTVNSEDAEVETQQGASTYAYDTYCIAQTEVNTTTLKLKVAATLTTTSTRILQSTAMVYASSSEETLPGYITNGTFKTGGTTLGSINVASAISGATEFTVTLASVRSALSLSAGDPFNIYILFDTTTPPTPVGPEILTEQIQYEVQRNQTSVAKGKIGYDISVRNWSMQRSYKATVSLVCSGDPVDCGIEWVDSTNEGLLFDNTSSPQTVSADSTFSVSASIANGNGIPITNILTVSGETYSTAETMEYVLDLMENQMMWFEIDLWYNSGSGDVHYASHPVQIYYSSNNFVPIQTD